MVRKSKLKLSGVSGGTPPGQPVNNGLVGMGI